MFVQVDVPGLEERVTLRAMPELRASLTLGTPVALDFDTDKALVFDADGARMRKVRRLSAAASEVA
jgi:multiple sugar transport system ATP-binding protein